MAWYLMFNFSLVQKWSVSTSYGFIKLENIPEANNSEVREKAVIVARGVWSGLRSSYKDFACSFFNPELVWRENLTLDDSGNPVGDEGVEPALRLAEELEEMARSVETPSPDEIKSGQLELPGFSKAHDPDHTAEQ
ncbi:MAG: hypothetical protein AAB725_00345 [Patescibacteria group bacterium]